MHTLSIEVQPPEASGQPRYQKKASGYFTIGTSGTGAEALNQQKAELRAMSTPRRKVAEALAVLPPAYVSPAFTLYDTRTHEQYDNVIERGVGTGQRMAKYGRWPQPVRHWTSHLGISTVQSERVGRGRFPQLLWNMARFSLGKLPVEIADCDGQACMEWLVTYPNESEQPLWAQVDGEAWPLENGAIVRIGLARTFRAITTKRTASTYPAVA